MPNRVRTCVELVFTLSTCHHARTHARTPLPHASTRWLDPWVKFFSSFVCTYIAARFRVVCSFIYACVRMCVCVLSPLCFVLPCCAGVVQGEEGEPDSVDKPGALLERMSDPDVDEDGNLVLHTFWVCNWTGMSIYVCYVTLLFCLASILFAAQKP